MLASLATLSLGVVLGPEAPLIAIGGGLGVLRSVWKQGCSGQNQHGSSGGGEFRRLSTLLGSPLLGAFLLMEASGLGGAMLELVLVPGLLAAGVGSLIFIGLDAWTGLGTFSLAIPGLSHLGSPTGAEFLWALAIGVMAALLGSGIRWFGLYLQPRVERRIVWSCRGRPGHRGPGDRVRRGYGQELSVRSCSPGKPRWVRSSPIAPPIRLER